MIVLGLNAFGQKPAACLLRDGHLAAFCQEERLNRLKGVNAIFPERAVKWCLTSQGIALGDVDRIALSWDCDKYPWRMLGQLAMAQARLKPDDSGVRDNSSSSIAEYLVSWSPGLIRNKVRDSLRSAGISGPLPRLEFVEHHLSHAWQAYWQSPFQDAAVLVADGSGEENCVSAWGVRRGRFRKLFGVDVPYSLGWFFGGFTAYLGFQPNRDEGKLMGLAALGQARSGSNPWPGRLDRILKAASGGYEMDPCFFKPGAHNHHPRFTDALAAFITGFDSEMRPVSLGETAGGKGSLQPRYLLPGYIDLAWAVQDRLEQVVLSLARRALAESGLQDLCLAGGVFMNCKVNGVLRDLSGARAIFAHPAASDDGSCIGAALVTAAGMREIPARGLHGIQLGPAAGNGEIQSCLEDWGVSYRMPDDICESTAGLIGDGLVVGWFQGGAEMGARALGGRSIVADPGRPGMKERVNLRVKRRENWRPYCPSLVLESAPRLLGSAEPFPHMIVARQPDTELAALAPATVHVDGSVRPQTVDSNEMPLWRRLIAAVGERTGAPVVLNTSLNVRGEPMACLPRDAIACLFTSGLDALAIGDYLIVKPGNGK